CLSGFCVDEQFELGALLDRQIGWPFTLEDASDVNASQPVRIESVAAIACEPAGCGERAVLKDCGHRVARREFAEPCASAGEQGISADDEPACAQLRELGK